MILLLFGLVVFFVVALLAIVATVGITLSSLVTLATAPRQLVALLRNRTVRRNHALEHATINVIEERYGPTHLGGLAKPNGFIIQGRATPDLVANAAQEALTRLRAGERRLAIHPRCGTTLVASQLVMAIAFIIALVLLRELTLWPFLIGLAAAALIGPRLSLVLQRFVTTDAQVGDLEIERVEIEPVSTARGLVALMTLGPIFVRTRPHGVPREPEPVTLVTGKQEEIPVSDYRVH